MTLAGLEGLLRPMAKTSKFHACQSTYMLNPALSKVPSRTSTQGGALNSSALPPIATGTKANIIPTAAGPSRLGKSDS